MTIRTFFLTGLLLLMWRTALANAQTKTPTVNGEPVVQPHGVVQFVVQGEFRPSLALARDSALQVAQERMREWLAKQNPPIRRVPSLDTIRTEMNVHEYGPPVEESILNQNDKMYKLTIEVNLPPRQIRALRERDRVVTGIWTLGGLLAILGVAALLFRIEEWTKGYLTRWLLAGGVATVILLFVTWWFVR